MSAPHLLPDRLGCLGMPVSRRLTRNCGSRSMRCTLLGSRPRMYSSTRGAVRRRRVQGWMRCLRNFGQVTRWLRGGWTVWAGQS